VEMRTHAGRPRSGPVRAGSAADYGDVASGTLPSWIRAVGLIPASAERGARGDGRAAEDRVRNDVEGSISLREE
jgi:hypothetical protein